MDIRLKQGNYRLITDDSNVLLQKWVMNSKTRKWYGTNSRYYSSLSDALKGYVKQVLKTETDEIKTLNQILDFIKELEDEIVRIYGREQELK